MAKKFTAAEVIERLAQAEAEAPNETLHVHLTMAVLWFRLEGHHCTIGDLTHVLIQDAVRRGKEELKP